MEPEFYRACNPWKSKWVFQCQCLHCSRFGNIRQRQPGFLDRTCPRATGPGIVEDDRNSWKSAASVSRRGLQCSEPHELCHPQYCGVLIGDFLPVANCRRDYRDFNFFAADSAWVEASVLAHITLVIIMATELSATTVCQLFASAPVKLLKRAFPWISQFAQTFQFVQASVAQNGFDGRAVERLTPTIGGSWTDRDACPRHVCGSVLG